VSAVDRSILLELARTAAVLRLDLSLRLTAGLSPDDRSLAADYSELVDRLKVLETLAQCEIPDDALLIMVLAETTGMLPMTSEAEAFVTAARTVLEAARDSMRGRL
jgi:hypothetical protein